MRDALGIDGVKPSRETATPLRFAGLVLDLDACTLARESGEAIPLTRGELALLRMFVARLRTVITVALCSTPSPTGGSNRSTAASMCWSEIAEKDRGQSK